VVTLLVIASRAVLGGARGRLACETPLHRTRAAWCNSRHLLAEETATRSTGATFSRWSTCSASTWSVTSTEEEWASERATVIEGGWSWPL